MIPVDPRVTGPHLKSPHALSSMRFVALLRAVPLPSPVFRPGPDRSRVLRMSLMALVKADPCSAMRAFLDSPRPAGLRILIPPARLLETGTCLSWALAHPPRVSGVPGPHGHRRTSIPKTFRDRLTRRNSGDLVRRPLSTWTVDRYLHR